MVCLKAPSLSDEMIGTKNLVQTRKSFTHK
jgi:hypothetical protein